jgi:soluble lytic murein transglycosylase-like protein
MPCFAALKRATGLAIVVAALGGNALADATPTPPPRPAQKIIAAPQAAKLPHVTAINVTRADSAQPARRGAGRLALLETDTADHVKTLVSQYAQRHGVPDTLAHRIVIRESRYNPGALSRAHFGLMQISLPTARQMGYTGAPQGLLDARTNLAFGMPYLANAWIVSGGDEGRALSLYSRGYYNDAKRKGLTRSLRQAHSDPVEPEGIESVADAQ